MSKEFRLFYETKSLFPTRFFYTAFLNKHYRARNGTYLPYPCTCKTQETISKIPITNRHEFTFSHHVRQAFFPSGFFLASSLHNIIKLQKGGRVT